MLAAAQFLHAPEHQEEAPIQALPARQGGELGASILGREVTRSATVLCPECHLAFGGMDALKRHCTQDHDFTICQFAGEIPRDVHGAGGLPTCAHCGHAFGNWSKLRRHIAEHNCPKHWELLQGRLSAVEFRLLARTGQLPDLTPCLEKTSETEQSPRCSASLPPSAPGRLEVGRQRNVGHPPEPSPDTAGPGCPQLVAKLDEVLRRRLSHSGWFGLHVHKSYCRHLNNHCVLCGQWIADARYFKHHMQNLHKAEWEKREDIEKECNLLAKHLSSPCQYCTREVARPGTHAAGCMVIWQAALLRRVWSLPLMGSYLLGSLVETGRGGRSQAQQRRRIREQQRDSSLQLEQGLVGVLPPIPSQAGSTELHPHLLRYWQARLNDGPWLKRQGAKCPLCSTAIRDLKALRQHCRAKHMTQWHMMPSHPPGSLLARAATPCPWCALTIKRPKLHAPSCLMVHIAGLEAVRQVCQNDVRDDAPADVCRDTPLLDGHPGRHSRQTPTRGRAGRSSTAEAEAQPREGSRQRQGNRSPGRQPGASSTATGRGQVATAPRCAAQPPRAGHDRALHVHQQALAAGGHPAPSVPDQCGVEETHGELAEAKHVAPITIFQALLLELKSRLQKIVGSEENKAVLRLNPTNDPVQRVSSRCRIAACPTAVSWNTSRSWRKSPWWKATFCDSRPIGRWPRN